ncbi:MAG: DUF2953 domain-containing protein [Oscillospiraceae bacterium]|nr:DUF2953 domain-containing protein [Oscillospiraceae bacterium]
MVATVILVILFILCVLLLLPVRAKGSFDDGKWSVSVYYAFIRVFHKESQEKKEPEKPPKPNDLPEGEALPEIKPEPQPKPKPKKPKPKPSAAESAPKPETVSEKPEQKPEPPQNNPDEKPEASEAPEAPEAPEPEAEEKPKKRGFIKRLKPQSVPEAIGLAKDACAALSPALRFLTKHLHFRHIRLYLAVATDDPANTATLYGKICAAAYNLLAQLQCWVDIETDAFRILADFYNDKLTFRVSGELRVSPMAAILLVLILGIKFLWRSFLRFRREDREAKLKAQETAPLPQT